MHFKLQVIFLKLVVPVMGKKHGGYIYTLSTRPDKHAQ